MYSREEANPLLVKPAPTDTGADFAGISLNRAANSYGLLDARKPTDRFAVAAWGKNLIDEHYASQALTQAGPAGYPYIAAPPLTFGVSFEFKL
jgi:outer membrane receptor protein involved in Fe transport